MGKWYGWNKQKSADPSRRDMEISYAGSKRCRLRPHPNQNPKSKLQNPNSKRRRLGPPQKERRLNWSKIQNPNSKIQDPRSKIQTPNSIIQTARLEFGFWILDLVGPGTGGDGYVANDDVWPRGPPWIWPSWRRTSLQPKGSRLDSPHGSIPPTRSQIGHRFPAEGLCRKSSPDFRPVSWKSGPNFRETAGQAGAAQNVRSTSRGAERVCKCKGGQHHAASPMCAYARDVSIA